MTPMTSHIEGSKSKYSGTDYCVTNGMSSMVKHFLKKSGATTKFQNSVNNIKITSENMIEVSTQVNINQFVILKLLQDLFQDQDSGGAGSKKSGIK